LTTRLRRVLHVLWFGLGVACAPAQSFRPAGALPNDGQGEVGVGFSRVGPRPYVAEGARPMAQGWWSTRWGETWLSSVLFGFDQSAVLGGWALRKDIVQSRFSASAEAELGVLWGALSLPVSLRFDRVQPYCAPRIGTWGPDLTGFLPCGLSLGPWQGFALRGELELSWADFAYYNRRLHLGIAVAQQW
jgi:hypothetical protein